MNVVVTNLRIPENSYKRHRIMAAEQGVSFNEYVLKTLEEKAVEKQFGRRPAKGKKTKKGEPDNIYDALLKLATESYEAEPMGLSEEDRAIYGD